MTLSPPYHKRRPDPAPPIAVVKPAPAPWWEVLAGSWDRIAATLEAAPSDKARVSILPTPENDKQAKAVATTARALAAGLRAAGRLHDA